MSFLTTLAAAFKGGGGARPVPIGRGFASPWASAFEASARTPPFDYATAVREGYLANPVAQRSVRIVAEGVGGAPLSSDAPGLLRLVRGSAGTTPLLEVLAAQLLLHGNAYVQILKDAAGAPIELFALRPERVSVIAGADGWPQAHAYRVGSETITLLLEDEAGWPNLIHLKGFIPADDHYGAGCLAAAAQAVSVHNAANAWNRALLDNAARPSGALVYAPGDGGALAPEQFERLKDELTQAYQGAGNAGRPMLLECVHARATTEIYPLALHDALPTLEPARVQDRQPVREHLDLDGRALRHGAQVAVREGVDERLADRDLRVLPQVLAE